MTPAKLRDYTCRDLAQMAKDKCVPGWHAMRKEELIAALVKTSKTKQHANGQASIAKASRASAAAATSPARSLTRLKSVAKDSRNGTHKSPNESIRRRISQLRSQLEAAKNLSSTPNGRRITDRLVVMVRDPYWLHAFWELTPQSIQRAQAALSQAWHTCRPILRVFHESEDGTATPIRDIEIHGGVNNWYVDVSDPPQKFRLAIGYHTADGAFYCVARSNLVTTPRAGTSDAVSETWADIAENADRIFAMSGGYSHKGTSQELQELLEERLRRPMGSPMATRYGRGAGQPSDDTFHFAVDAEVIVYGVSRCDAHVTLKGEPVQLRPDGTFTVRLNLPDRRQVIPVVASTGDGGEQRTIVLAIERNTKVMEPVIRDIGTV